MITFNNRLLPLPDNSFFRCVTRRSLEEKYQTFYNITIQKCLDDPKKEYHPALDTLSHPYLAIVPLDIDDLDLVKQNMPWVNSWDDVKDILKTSAPEGCIFQTSSGKWKCLLLATGIKSHRDQLNFINRTFPEQFTKCLDLRERALRRVFLNQSSFAIVRQWLLCGPPVMNVPESKDVIINQKLWNVINEITSFPVSDDDLPKRVVHEPGYKDKWIPYAEELPFKVRSINAMRVVRFMLAEPFHALAGNITVSQRRLADMFNTDQASISRGIEAAIRAGFLEKTGGYIMNTKACTYKLVGRAAEYANTLLKISPKKGNSIKLPFRVPKHEWNEFILGITHRFINPNDFLAAIREIKDSNTGTRMKEAKAIWNCHARKHKLEMCV